MSDFRKHLERSLQDEGFAWEWEEQSAERDVMCRIVEARTEQGLTQQSSPNDAG